MTRRLERTEQESNYRAIQNSLAGSSVLEAERPRQRRSDNADVGRVPLRPVEPKLVDGDEAFLANDRVPEPVWRGLSPAQRDLHLLWKRTLIPAYDDHQRVRRRDVTDRERQIMLALLRAVTRRMIGFRVSRVNRAAGYEVTSFSSQARFSEELLRLTVEVESSSLGVKCIAVDVKGEETDLCSKLTWLPQDTPSRGTVTLFPQARRTNHHFNILALNADQFGRICDALCQYLSAGRVS